MRRLLITASALALLVTPAAAKCHGHTDGKHWTLNLSSWTDAELLEMSQLADFINSSFNLNEPESAASVSAVVDQFECSGVSHADAVKNLIGAASAIDDLKKD
jgi:hypothetical protein